MSHSWWFCLTDNVILDLSQWKLMQCTVIGLIPMEPFREGQSVDSCSLMGVERRAVHGCGQFHVHTPHSPDIIEACSRLWNASSSVNLAISCDLLFP